MVTAWHVGGIRGSGIVSRDKCGAWDEKGWLTV